MNSQQRNEATKDLERLTKEIKFPIDFCKHCGHFDITHEDDEGWSWCDACEQYVQFNETCRLKLFL